NGHDSGQGDGIRAALGNDVMNVIGRLDTMRWFIEGDQAAVFYDLHATVGLPDGMAPPPPLPIAERFRVQNGLIKEIEAIFGPPPEPARDNATCVNGHWPGVVDGRPTQLQVGADAAVYVWHDTSGWHLRATHPGTDRKVISGKITSDGDLYAVARRTEGRDIV